jgi:hypothetical protein
LQVACLPATRGKKKVKSSSEENGAVYEGRKALWMRGRAILEKRSSGASTAENKEARRRGALDTHTRTHMHTHIALVMLFAEMHAVLTVFFFFFHPLVLGRSSRRQFAYVRCSFWASAPTPHWQKLTKARAHSACFPNSGNGGCRDDNKN